MTPSSLESNRDARFWSKIAEKYARQPVQDPNAFERKIAVTRGLLPSTGLVLDVGCGTGSLALRLAPFTAHVRGLDFSPEMVRIARQKAVTLGVSNVRFDVGTLGPDSLQAASFDAILAFSLLHLVADRRHFLERVHQLLKPGGYFVSSTVCLGDTHVPYGMLIAAMRVFGQAPTVHILSKSGVADAIAAAGFINVSAPDVGAKSDIAFLVAQKPPDGAPSS